MSIPCDLSADAVSIAQAIRSREHSAREVMQATLESVREHDGQLNCFTKVLEAEALAQADATDRRIAAGDDPGPLAGVPFAVKNLFDIAGTTTIAGSKIHASNPPAKRDAAVVERLKAAGANVVGALNMDEYAYGFTTENTHYGPTRNPYDLERVAGGSSGRLCCRGRLRHIAADDWIGHQWINSGSCGILRNLRTEANLRSNLSRRSSALRGELRSCRSICALGARYRPHLRCPSRTRSTRSSCQHPTR